ncbi:unnamed protein product [Soboliphyme baturini]|uniref:Autophagy-related protein 101 n=1 Tax=Soboliphyme baturini TaxID=241478 RepID=A0A183ILJ9_9BILA|nr:unnamed protein product [Soboliphyme baturini]
MNAFSQQYEITVEGRQIEEAVASIVHTLFVHRSLGKFKYKAEGSYYVGTLGTEDVDCSFIDFTYVRLSSEEFTCSVDRQISNFRDLLRQSADHSDQNDHGGCDGQLFVEFYEKRRRNWPFGEESVPWEVWALQVHVVHPTSEHGHQQLRESAAEALSDIVFSICRTVNRSQYLPKMPLQSELSLVFDTSFSDVQPYLHHFKHQTKNTPLVPSLTSAVQKLLRGTLSF